MSWKLVRWPFWSAIFLTGVMVSAAQESSRPDSSLIQGIVRNAKTGEPLRGVTLTLASEDSQYSASTDVAGRFSIKGVAPGHYAVHPSKETFFPSAPITITVGAGQQLKDVNTFLTPGAVITGKVFDGDRQAIGDAVVMALKPLYVNGRRVLVPSGASKRLFLPPGAQSRYEAPQAVSNEHGEYRIFGLESGTYYVAVWRAGTGKSGDLPPEYYPGVSDPALAVPILIENGVERYGIDFGVVHRELHTFTFKVASPSVPPYDCSMLMPVLQSQKAFVLVRRTPDLDVIHFMNHFTGSFRAILRDLGDKRWTSPPLPPGSYEIYHNPCIATVLGLVGRLDINLSDRDVDVGTLIVPPSVAVRGRIDRVGAQSVVVERLRIRLRPLDLRSASPAMVPNGPSDLGVSGDGFFSFTFKYNATYSAIGTVAPGSYQIDIAGLPPDAYVASVRYAGREVRDRGFQVDGEQPGFLDVTLREPGGRIDGVVLNREDKASPHSFVVLIPTIADRENSNLFRTIATDQNGAFTVRGIPPGEYGLLALESIEDGAGRSKDFLDQFERRAEKVRITNGSSVSTNVRLIPR